MKNKKSRRQIKNELKQAIVGSASFDEIIHRISIYIFDNYKLRNKPIDSERILKLKRKRKKEHRNE